IIAEESSNSLLVRATADDWALVQQIVQGVDLRPLQVLIEVTIAEVQRTHDLDVGVSGKLTRTPAGKTKPDVTATAPSQSSARDFIVELTGGHGTIQYDVAINALQSRGDVRVLSLPVIIAQNNKQAQLNVGSSRPFVQTSQTVPLDPTSRVQTTQYIDVGMALTITPTINPDRYVNLVVTQQDNSATNEIQFDAPVINKRDTTRKPDSLPPLRRRPPPQPDTGRGKRARLVGSADGGERGREAGSGRLLPAAILSERLTSYVILSERSERRISSGWSRTR